MVSKKEIEIDARGPRFSAAITTLVLAIALTTHSVWVILFQGVIFAIGAMKGPQFTPYAYLFRTLIRPRLKSEARGESVRPPQFAQRVGLYFMFIALLGWASAVPLAFTIAVSFALAAAFLNAAFDYCLGCEAYLLLLRLRSPRIGPGTTLGA